MSWAGCGSIIRLMKFGFGYTHVIPNSAAPRAIDLINQNHSEDVLRVLDRLDADAYL
jgi:hypothetical protein